MSHTYKHSRFNVIVKIAEDRHLLFNTRTHGMIEADPETLDYYHQLTAPTEALSKKFCDFGLWIPTDVDEIEEIKFIHRKRKFATQRLMITIKTTNACNFMCKYCYQEHLPEKLSDDTLNNLIKFFENQIHQSNVKEIALHWFGGEPLLNIDPILKIEKFLEGKVDTLSSGMTTNGFLLTEETLEKLAQTHLTGVQVTLDGTREQHNQTRVLPNGKGTFDEIIANLRKVRQIKPNITIVIRVNVTKYNKNIDPFLELLKEEELLGHVQIRLTEAKKFSTSYTEEDIFYENTEQYSKDLLNIYKRMADYGLHIPRNGFFGTNCDFDCISNFMVETDGRIYQCTSSESEGADQYDKFYLGRITETGEIEHFQNNLIAKMLREPFNNEECLQCKVLPWCMGGCNHLEKIGYEKCIPERYILEDLIKLHYETVTKDM